MLQECERVLDRPMGLCVGGAAKSDADRHEGRSAHHGRRANYERGKTSEELPPWGDKRTHPSQFLALINKYTRQLHPLTVTLTAGTQICIAPLRIYQNCQAG